jgi:hypothetical protein
MLGCWYSKFHITIYWEKLHPKKFSPTSTVLVHQFLFCSKHTVTYLRYAGHPLPHKRWRNKRCHCYGNRQVNSPPPPPRWRGGTSHCDVTRDTAVDTGNRQPATGNRQQATGNRQQATGNRQQATGNGIKSWRNIMRVSLWSRATEESVWLVVTKSEQWTRKEEPNTVVRRSYSVQELRNQQVKIYCVTSRLVSTVVQWYWECVIQWDLDSSHIINTWRLLRTEWIDCCVNPQLCCNCL